MTKGSEQLYVCPPKCPERRRLKCGKCYHNKNHELINECVGKDGCPACIPVEPDDKCTVWLNEKCSKCRHKDTCNKIGWTTCTKFFPVEPEKKEEKCETCYYEKMNDEQTQVRCGLCEANNYLRYVPKGTGKAVGQGVGEILYNFQWEVIRTEWKVRDKRLTLNERDSRLEEERRKAKQQLESFYRKEYLGKVEKKLKDCGGWNLSVCTAIEELKQSKQ